MKRLILISLLISVSLASLSREPRQTVSAAGSQTQGNAVQGSGLIALQSLMNLVGGSLQTALALNLPLVISLLSSGAATAAVGPQTVSQGPSASVGGPGGPGWLLNNLYGGGGSYRSPPRMSCRIVDTRMKTLMNEPGVIIPLPFSGEVAESIAKSTYGFTTTDGNTKIHSVVSARSAKITNDTERKPTQEELEEQLEEYSFQSVMLLAKDLFHAMSETEDVTKSLDCQLQTFECTLSHRKVDEKLRQCAEQLCACLKPLHLKL